MPGTEDESANGQGLSSLTSVIFEEEQQRLAAAKEEVVVLPDDLLPGVGGKGMRLSEGLKQGGVSMIVLLLLLIVVEEFQTVALLVLGPDIQESLDISDTTLLGLISFGGVVLVLASLPFAWLADRYSRTKVLSIATAVWGACGVGLGFIVNPFQMAFGTAGTGIGKSANIPITPSLIADQYPIGVRTRMFAAQTLGRPIGQVVGPIVAGGIVLIAGDQAGDWRWVFWMFGFPAVGLAIAFAFKREPKRGRNEQEAVFGEDITETENLDGPVRLSAAMARLKKVRTFYFLIVGIGVLGFALVAVPATFNLLMKDVYGYGAFQRGWIMSITWSVSVIAIPIAGRYGERLFRRNPPSALKLMGASILMYGFFLTVGLRFQQAAILIAFFAIGNACQGMAFTQLGPTISAVVPYQMRAQAFSMVGVYIFLMGGFFGGLLTGAFSDAFGQRTALTVVIPVATLIGGLMIIYGSRYMKRDISLTVSELIEMQEEQKRMAADPENIPMLQVRNVDASYGTLQVLFDVSFEVKRGECLALLGTNGAGKSTILRSISGLLNPDRGVIRMNGRTITLVDPQYRVALGMMQIPGGEAVFPSMTVSENLEIWSELIEDKEKRAERIEETFAVFPELLHLVDSRAGSLSGGQQQMLALGKAIMLEPELLLIDELSLGLAPIVVQRLLGIVEKLKEQGTTMVLVEQSVNVALAVADRAVFMERGQVKFEGPAQELLERDDLLRAVFLSGEGA
ncbi:MAG: MFS transporter [Actinomycetia bacterium]|jgi:ABC-type branched-subunit amino acid transport system ATPase component/predicted MFS family arabinose efflux permease|nr:MFS transporter [Actinomycetes bacterium]